MLLWQQATHTDARCCVLLLLFCRFPQVYIGGEFYGGCDIMIEAFQNGELQETLERVLNE